MLSITINRLLSIGRSKALFIGVLSVFTVFILLPITALGSAMSEACDSAIEDASSTISQRAISSMHNVFPLKMGGAEIRSFDELEDTPSEISTVCGPCLTPPFNEPVFGISVSYWQPIAIAEITAIPHCLPTYGTSIDVDNLAGSNSMGNRPTENDKSLYSYQAHYLFYPAFAVMDLGGSTCARSPTAWDIPYMSEYDPRWQDDVSAAVFFFEVMLVSNPLTQLSCGIDAIAANLGFPLDILWWCMGSWGSMYPVSGNTINVSAPQAAIALAVRLIKGLSRPTDEHPIPSMELTVGAHMSKGYCTPVAMIDIRKTLYSFVPIYPTMYENRIPIGRSGIVWEYGIDAPVMNQGVYAYVVYRKVECCFL
jgi:conjugal transfer pilus assembly protein TraU